MNCQKQAKQRRYAQLLLDSYRQRPQNMRKMDLNQYLTLYASKIGEPVQVVLGTEEENQLVQQYKQLKQTLNKLLNQNRISLEALRPAQVLSDYSEIKQLIGRRQLATLSSLHSQLQTFTEQAPSQEDELVRIKKVLSNGMWGCLDKIKDRLAKLHQLQNDIHK